MHTRRDTLASISATAAFAAVASEAFAAWEPSERYPDPSVQVLDPSFNKYRLLLVGVMLHAVARTEVSRAPMR
jgi:gluconolactonase